MTIREAILNLFSTDLLKITAANGYNNTITSCHPVFRELSRVTSFPQVNYFFGRERIEPASEDMRATKNALPLVILVHIQEDTDITQSGIITSSSESWVSDFKHFFDTTGAAGCELFKEVPGIDGYYISLIEPYSDTGANRQTVGIELTIEYTETVTDITAE